MRCALAREHKGGRVIAERLAPLGFSLQRRGMRLDGKLQRDLVFVRDVEPANNGTKAGVGARLADIAPPAWPSALMPADSNLPPPYEEPPESYLKGLLASLSRIRRRGLRPVAAL